MSNERINLARVEKNDEFYTQLEDISNELQYYKNKSLFYKTFNYKNQLLD